MRLNTEHNGALPAGGLYWVDLLYNEDLGMALLEARRDPSYYFRMSSSNMV